MSADVEMETLRPHSHNGIAGEFYCPKSYDLNRDPAPVIVFTGSTGGLGSRTRAALLASCGIPSLALAYFNYPGTPDRLNEIPLEYFSNAMAWIKGRVNWSGGIGVIGSSRGGELALLLGATFPEVSRVVAITPSHAIWGGHGKHSAWTLNGKPLPHMIYSELPEVDEAFAKLEGSRAPIALTPIFKLAHESPLQDPQAIIPVERINGKILLISGTDDQMWPSSFYSKKVISRLRKHGLEQIVQHLDLEGAGHAILPPYLPSTIQNSIHPVSKDLYAYGGTEEKDAAANEASWRAILEFLGARSRQ